MTQCLPEVDRALTHEVIGAAMTVHRALGPGAGEAAYEEALSIRLSSLGISHQCQIPLPLAYKERQLDCGYRLDVVVEQSLLLELKAVAKILPIHEAQLLTYMRLGSFSLGYLLNFEGALMKDGVHRRILTQQQQPTEPTTHSDEQDPILAAAIETHIHLGPGLMKSAYQACLCAELLERGIPFQEALDVPISFEGQVLRHPMTIPLLVDNEILVYASAREITKTDEAHLLARLRQNQWPHGYIINFNATSLRNNIRRINLM